MKIRICASTNSSLRKYELEQEDCEEEDENLKSILNKPNFN